VSVSPLVHIVMIGWLPVLMTIFAVVRGHRAVIAAFLVAWLFLPMFAYDLPGVPDYTKVSATTFGVFLAALLFDSGRLMAFRPRWFDLPMALLCLVLPMVAALVNGLGPYDGLSDVAQQCVFWGLPYLLGRLYFSSWDALRDLAVGLVLGGLVYVPLCVLEMKMSPQLHNWVYGYHQHSFAQTYRFGGWRPMVFMQHGLAVGTFMAAATLAAFWLWLSGSVRKVWNMNLLLVVPALFVTSVLCRSAGALALLMVGIGSLIVLRFSRTKLAVALMLALPLVYIGLRTVPGWTGGELVEAAQVVSSERAESLRTRLDSERLLWNRASQHLLLGWGRSGRSMVLDDDGKAMAIPDGMWIIMAGIYGITGLGCFLASMMLGPLALLVRVKAREWNHPAAAGAVCVVVILAMHMVDNLFNAMLNPIFVLGAGGLAGVAFSPLRRVVSSRPLQGSRPMQSLRSSMQDASPRDSGGSSEAEVVPA
jgi:hypothetical protein